MRDSQLFVKAVEAYFEPIARKLGLPLCKVRDGVYDIPSQYFIMRVRLDTGHRRGLNVILRPSSFREFDENQPNIQLGIGNFIQFHGENPQDTLIEVSSDESFLDRARLLAVAAAKYAEPYLRGQGTDWSSVSEMVRRKTEKDVVEIRKYRFPKNVRKEWI
ncbi:MAG TPA: hypothetical protein VMP11_02315 [Verrucomicrobiae bacterium]|nr:hypothetical protein [Verrucomicrobiae bacterium]